MIYPKSQWWSNSVCVFAFTALGCRTCLPSVLKCRRTAPPGRSRAPGTFSAPTASRTSGQPAIDHMEHQD